MPIRRRAVTTALGLALVCAPSAAAPQDAPDQPAKTTFRSTVDVVSVAAIVRDKRGRFASGLKKEDFVVEEAGARRDILQFHADANAPVRVALLFDVSGSMAVGTKLGDARHAADHVIGWLRAEKDEAALFAFDSSLQELQPFTANANSLHEALDRLRPFGATSLYDAIGETAKRLAARTLRHRAVVVISDGVDTNSRLSAEQVSAAASAIDVPVYVVAVVSPLEDPESSLSLSRSGVAAMDGDLGRLADWTGGRLFVVSAPAAASSAARELLEEMRHQYLLAFEPARESGWRPLEIRTRDKGLIIRARSGYFAGLS